MSLASREVNTRPEHDLLLWSARICTERERADHIRALCCQAIDWTHVLKVGHRHGMLPLLYRHLENICPEAVPPTTLTRLRDLFRENTRCNLLLTRELLRLLDLFQSQAIPAIPFKGPVLAVSLYGNLALRAFVDLDILVHQQDVQRAKNLLISLGYQPVLAMSPAHEAVFLQSRNALSLAHHDLGIAVDLHWAMIPRHFGLVFDLESLWGRLHAVPLGSQQVLTLAPEDLFLLLYVHGAKHLWERLGWLCDFARLADMHRKMHWGQALEQAGRLGSRRMLAFGLLLVRDLLSEPLPGEVLQAAQADPVAQSLAAHVWKRFYQGAAGPPGDFELLFFHIQMRERMRDRIGSRLRLAMRPSIKDWECLPLPRTLSFLYYGLRPFRLVGKYALLLLRRGARAGKRSLVRRTSPP